MHRWTRWTSSWRPSWGSSEWGFGGGVDTELIDPWNVVGRYGWVGGTGTSAYVHPDGTVAVLLTQVGLADPAIEVLQTFWRYSKD